MFRHLIASWMIRAISLSLGLYLLNISVDNGDKFVDNSELLGQYNDQESIAEIVLEQMLGFKDAIPESEDAGGEDSSSKQAKIKIIQFPPAELSSFHGVALNDSQGFMVEHKENPGNLHRDFPPPRS